ncbi:MAG: sensor histidine kinase [Desulfovibrionaceae bacterium]
MTESHTACVFRVDYLRNVFLAACVIAIALPLLNVLVIYPAFTHELEAMAEESGVRMAHYFHATLGAGKPFRLSDAQTPAFRDTVASMQAGFGFIKIKVYAPDGQVVYSVDPGELASFNTGEDFKRVAATRTSYSHLVRKWHTTQEGAVTDRDVVETYVPLADNNQLIGVLEFYFDISARKRSLDSILASATAGVTVFAAILFGIFLLTLRRAAGSIKAREQAEAKQRALNKELAQANERLMELDHLKTAFLSSVSHELRTPLTSILGFIRLIHKDVTKYFIPLAQEPTTTHKARRIQDNLDIIALEGGRLLRLVNSVLDLHKIEAGKMEWHMATEDMNAIARRAALAMSSLFEENAQVELRLDLADALPPVHMDSDRIEQVILNLLSNAAKFTRAGNVTLSTRARDGMVELAVADTGNGIRPEELDNVFETYYQATRDKEEAATYQGTGLGLAICRQIVEHHQGRISATSVHGKGSVFSFTLPASAAPAASPAS